MRLRPRPCARLSVRPGRALLALPRVPRGRGFREPILEWGFRTLFFSFPPFPGATAPAAGPRPNLSGPDLQPSLISDYLKITAASGRVRAGARAAGAWSPPLGRTPAPLFIFLHGSPGRHCSAHAREVKGERSGCG